MVGSSPLVKVAELSCDTAVVLQPLPIIDSGQDGILVGSPTTFEERIKNQSSSSGHPNLLAQYSQLAESYRYWRAVRGDGNCYYRALAYGFVEHSALFCPDMLMSLLKKMASMSDKGRQNGMFAGSYRALSILLPSWQTRLMAYTGNEDKEKAVLMEIHRAFNTPAIDQAFVAAIRLLVADYLAVHKSEPCTDGADADCSFTWDQWAYGMMDAGIDGPGGFVDSAVLRMGEDASDLVQAAAPRALDCCVRITMVHRDRTTLQNIDYGNAPTPQVHLLFQPGHYELLIPKEPERYSVLPITEDAALVPNGVPVQGPPQPNSAASEFEGFMQQVLSKYHTLWGQARYLSGALDQLLPRLDAHARPNTEASPADARSELTEMRNALKNMMEAQRQLCAMPEDPMDEAAPPPPPPPPTLEENDDDQYPMPRYLAALRKMSQVAQPPPPDGGINLKVEDGTEEALMDWPELQNSAAPVTTADGLFVCSLCNKEGRIGGEASEGVRTPCGDRVHQECLRHYINGVVEKEKIPLLDVRCWQHHRRFGQPFLKANMPEPKEDTDMQSDDTGVATADEPEHEEAAETCPVCRRSVQREDLRVTAKCGCHFHKACLKDSVETAIKGGMAPAEIECPEHKGKRFGAAFLESTVPEALEPIRSVWGGFSSRVAAAAVASGKAPSGPPPPPRGGTRMAANTVSTQQKVEPVKAPMPSRTAPWSAGAARCNLCRDTLLSAESARLPCRHRFHERCVADVFTKQIADSCDGLKCPICNEGVPIEANDILLKSCLDPGVYYKLHSSRAPSRVVPPGKPHHPPKPSRSPDTNNVIANDNVNLRQKFERGWRPCPKQCGYLGNFPKSGHPDYIKCLCGYEYCSGCGVDEHVIAAHDGRWHRPSCPYFEKYSAFKGSPHASSQCPQCTQLHRCCPFPKSDGYPDKLMRSLLTGPRPEIEHPPRPAPWARG